MARRFDRKAAMRETWLSENQRLVAQVKESVVWGLPTWDVHTCCGEGGWRSMPISGKGAQAAGAYLYQASMFWLVDHAWLWPQVSPVGTWQASFPPIVKDDDCG